MKLHVLKILPNYFDDVRVEAKKAELRFNDRDFKVNDFIHFVQTDGREFPYSTDNLFIVTHVLKDVEHLGLAKGWAILSIERLK